ncbi:MAG: DUF4271 domain-containing protein [Phycisphaerales bacterium]|nr:DUF4271 domain-containing protein [Phycisphaerales bacterium]
MAKVNTASYGLIIDKKSVQLASKHRFDSTVQNAYQMRQTKTISYLSRPHFVKNTTIDFYLLLGLCAILGIIRTSHPKYFTDIWRAFINPTLGNRQLKDLIQGASFPNLLMNLFSCIVLGVYVYYLITIHKDWRFASVPNSIFISLLTIGAILLYVVKYIFVQFTGWAFDISNTTEQYNFNIFLVNKVLSIALLPFIVCFAFLNPAWSGVLSIMSIILLVVFLVNRYFRSWNVFAQFFMNSRFHFFMYLCAFEILPMVMLLKVILRTM